MSQNRSEVKSELGDAGKGSDQLSADSVDYSLRRSMKQGGTKTMNKWMKQLVAVMTVGLMALAGTMKHNAWADRDVTNDTATIVITITPNVDRAVTITTDNVNMNLGNVDLSSTTPDVSVATQTVSPATVTVTGTIANTDLLLSANITNAAGETAWSFETASGNVLTDRIATWVTFSGISTTTTPSQTGSFFNGTAPGTNSDLVDGTSARVGTDSTTDDGRYENGFSMNRFGTGSTKRHMWMRFRMPSGTTSSAAENIKFILTVVPAI